LLFCHLIAKSASYDLARDNLGLLAFLQKLRGGQNEEQRPICTRAYNNKQNTAIHQSPAAQSKLFMASGNGVGGVNPLRKRIIYLVAKYK